jgi:hypothetical protein
MKQYKYSRTPTPASPTIKTTIYQTFSPIGLYPNRIHGGVEAFAMPRPFPTLMLTGTAQVLLDLAPPWIAQRVANVGHNRPPEEKYEVVGIPQVALCALSRDQIYSTRTTCCKQHYS